MSRRTSRDIPPALVKQRSLRESELLELLPIGRTALRGLQDAGRISKPIQKVMPGATRPINIYPPAIVQELLDYLATADSEVA